MAGGLGWARDKPVEAAVAAAAGNLVPDSGLKRFSKCPNVAKGNKKVSKVLLVCVE